MVRQAVQRCRPVGGGAARRHGSPSTCPPGCFHASSSPAGQPPWLPRRGCTPVQMATATDTARPCAEPGTLPAVQHCRALRSGGLFTAASSNLAVPRSLPQWFWCTSGAAANAGLLPSDRSAQAMQQASPAHQQGCQRVLPYRCAVPRWGHLACSSKAKEVDLHHGLTVQPPDDRNLERNAHETNVGTTDRLIRIAVGAALIGASLLGLIGVWGWIGLVPIATVLFSFCPAYLPFGWSTCATPPVTSLSGCS